jgi:hypothetical protein
VCTGGSQQYQGGRPDGAVHIATEHGEVQLHFELFAVCRANTARLLAFSKDPGVRLSAISAGRGARVFMCVCVCVKGSEEF